MNKAFEYFNDTWRTTTILWVGAWDEFDKYLRKKWNLKGKNEKNPNYSACWFSIEDDDGRESAQFIWIPSFEWVIDDIVSLQHECLHNAIKIMQHRGANVIVGDESEQLNYTVDAHFRYFLNALKKELVRSNNEPK